MFVIQLQNHTFTCLFVTEVEKVSIVKETQVSDIQCLTQARNSSSSQCSEAKGAFGSL
jgi:hypothetical protein